MVIRDYDYYTVHLLKQYDFYTFLLLFAISISVYMWFI